MFRYLRKNDASLFILNMLKTQKKKKLIKKDDTSIKSFKSFEQDSKKCVFSKILNRISLSCCFLLFIK